MHLISRSCPMATLINTKRVAILIFLFMSQSTMAADAKLRGVHPSLIERYKSSNKLFLCLNNEKSIPVSQVNDDYCDCSDGSDEPGTNACNNGWFYCNNYGFEPKNISSTRVNDGVCDCCDGSDEYRGFVRCQNVCKTLREEKLKEEKRVAALFAEGAKIRERYIQEAAGKREAALVKRAQLQEELTRLEAVLAEAVRRKDEAAKAAAEAEQAKQREKVAELDHNVRDIFDTIDANKDGKVTSVEIIDYAPAFKGELLEICSEPEHAQQLARGMTLEEFKDQIYPRLFNQKEVAPSTTETIENEEISDNDDDAETEDYELPKKAEDQLQPAAVENSHLEELKSEHDRINGKVSEARRALQELDYMDRIDFGFQHEYLVLYGKRLRLEENQYIYELNMFKDVYQQAKSNGYRVCIGRWGKWKDEIYGVMEYTDGEGCWKGPTRSTTVEIKCGLENRLISVNEPQRCRYEMKIESPAACSLERITTKMPERSYGKDEL